MRLLDRHILKEFLGPFLFGIAAFMVILVGVQLAPTVLRLLVRDHFPPRLVAQVFLLRLPQVIAFTLPMATIFGSLMSMANMSSNGEIIAVRAGGVSLLRLSIPILVMGVLVSGLNLCCAEVVVPASMDAAYKIQSDWAANGQPVRDLHFFIPPTGQAQRVVSARSYDPRRKVLQGLMVAEMKNGRFWQIFSAEEAEWYGREWTLRNVEHTVIDPLGGQRVFHLDAITVDIGKDPVELTKRDKTLDDMALKDLKVELPRGKYPRRQIIQYMKMHWALPWVSLGFALIGIPLGLRPVRATAGIGLGLSLVIAFAYYVLFNALHLIGQQGALPSVVAAWLPNGVLFGAGLTLFLNARR